MEARSVEFDYLFNIILVGDSGVGKTSIINRFTRDSFTPAVDATIGVEFRTKTLYLNASSTRVRLQLWDTAGHERLRSLTRNFYRQADAVLFVYDVTDAVTFRSLTDWLQEAGENTQSHVIRWLVGNKIDCNADLITVSRVQSERFASSNGLTYSIQTSAKSGNNVGEIFQELSRLLVTQLPINKSGSVRRKNSKKKSRSISTDKKDEKVTSNINCCKI